MNIELILKELQFKAVRSSGPGGQHVNKTSSKVEVMFDLFASEGLTASEKETLQTKLAGKISAAGMISVNSSESRSQFRNKRLAIDRMLLLLEENLKKAKPRKKTKPSRAVIEKRLQNKKRHSLKKADRKPPPES